MGILQFIQGLLLSIKEVMGFLREKQQLDAGRALEKSDVTDEHNERVKRGKQVDHDHSTRTDDFKL